MVHTFANVLDRERPLTAIEKPSQPVRIPKAAVIVAGEIRRRIVRGELKEGDALPSETELMRFFDVSRPTLREAMRILEAESLIAVKRGARVERGQPVGTAGSAPTGSPGLYLEVRVDGRAVDPLQWLKKR